MKIETILIVGAGSTGWMCATYMRKKLKNVDISIIESKSDDSPPISVGESTTPEFNKLLKTLEIDRADFMRSCNAVYKSTIKFTNWKEYPVYFPFARHETPLNFSTGLLDYGYTRTDIVCNSKFKNFELIRDDRMNEEIAFGSSYQLDAKKLSKYLRDNYTQGINIVNDDIQEVVSDGKKIEKLIGKKSEYTADLYIDATGFKSMLLSTLDEWEFTSFKNELINDTAWATHVKYLNKEKQLETSTDGLALPYGWVWNIPLWDSIGTGYVYSSQFQSDDDALEAFKTHLMVKHGYSREYIDSIEINKIPMRTGISNKSMIGNVAGIGISYMFIEPLESTGLLLTIDMIEALTDLLSSRYEDKSIVNPADIAEYNENVHSLVLSWKKFVLDHFIYADYYNNEYWDYYKGLTVTDFSTNLIKDQMVSKKDKPDLKEKVMFELLLEKQNRLKTVSHLEYLKKHIYI